MKNIKHLGKRGFTLFLTLVMCLGMVNLTAFAAQTPEHVHNEDGWVCVQGEGTRQLVCEVTEHTHEEECYTAGEPVLTCGEDESEGHTHGADCCGEAPLTCSLEESEEHEHTEDCYGEAPLTCGKEESEGHAHDEECYTEGEPVLTCEAAEHTHGEECYTVTEGAWTCTPPEQNSIMKVQRTSDAVNSVDEIDQSAYTYVMNHDLYIPAGYTTRMALYNDNWLGSGIIDRCDLSDAQTVCGSSKIAKITDNQLGDTNTINGWSYGLYCDYVTIQAESSAQVGETARLAVSYTALYTNYGALETYQVPCLAIITVHITSKQELNVPQSGLKTLGTVPGGGAGSDGCADDLDPTSSTGKIDCVFTNSPTGAVTPTLILTPKGQVGDTDEIVFHHHFFNQRSVGDIGYVTDLIHYCDVYNATITEGSSDNPGTTDDADVTHHVYMPAGTSTTLESYVPYLLGGSYNVSGQAILENGDESVATAGNLSKRYYNNYNSSDGQVLQIPITSAADAEKGATTTILVQQKWNGGDYTCVEKIVVHIIEPREEQLAVGNNVSMSTLGNGSGFEQINAAVSNNTTAVTVSSSGQTGYTATRKAAGDASVEYQYRYVESVYSGHKGGYSWNLQPINYRQQTVYVDVTNFTVDGLSITKEVNKTTAVGGDELVYTITVTNDSSVAKPVTVTDSLPNGTTFVRSDSTEDATHDGNGTVTWTPTVPAGGKATLKIVVKIADGAYGTLRNVANLTSGNGGKKQAYVETTVTPKSTPTYDLVVNKTMAESTNAAGDDIVTFTVTVENKSNVSLYNLMLVDTMDKTLEPTQDMDDVQVTVTGNGENTDVVFMGARDDVKAPVRDGKGHIVWTNEGGLTRTTDGEDKWDFTWMLEGEFKPNATVTLTYSAKIIYPENADSVEYYNYADAIAGAKKTDVPQYDGRALFGFVTGGSGGVGGSGGSGAVGGIRHKYTLTYDFTGGTWTQGETTCSTYKVEKWSEKGYYAFTVDGNVQPTKDGYTFQNEWTREGSTYRAGGTVVVTDSHENRNVTIYAEWAAKPSVTVNYVTDGGTQLGSIKYYPEQGTEYDHSVGNGAAVPTAGDANTKSPKTITVGGKTYAYDSVATESSLTGVMSGESVTITVVYAEDAKGGSDPSKEDGGSDGIPDKYQVKVTFKVENGEWNDGGKDDVVKYVVKYTDGTMNANGTATLADVAIPAAGNQPDEGYEAGSWNAEPTEATTVTGDTTFIYTYQEAHVHTFVEDKNDDGSHKWVKAPDCITDGTVKFVCSCGAEETRTVTGSALGHDFNGATATDNCTSHSDANCTGHTLTCVRCKGTLTGGKETQPHSYGDWIEDTAATMTTEGTKHRECSACGHVENGTIPTLDKVTITIKYVDENGSVVDTKEVEAEKGKPYNVTGDIDSNVPSGYEIKTMPDDATGIANENKTITVPVVAEAWTVWVNNGNALNGAPTLAWMKGHVEANQYANTDEANRTSFYAPTNELKCLDTDYTFYEWALNEPIASNVHSFEHNGALLELRNVWIYDAVFLGHKDVTVEKIFDGEGLTENDLPENFTLTYNNGTQTLTAADATKFTNADGKPGYRWTLNAEVLTYYDWTYCYLEEANTDIKGYTLSGTDGWDIDENGNRHFKVRLISYDDLPSWSVEDMMKAPGIEQTFTITNHYTKNPVVTITIKYVDEDGNAVGTETVEVEKNKSYNVTDKTEKIPEGYEFVRTEGDPATGIANENKTITVVVKKTTTPENPDPVDPNPTYYNVRYSWSGLPAGAGVTPPNNRSYRAGVQVKVDTSFAKGTTVTVGDKTYEFSGWSKDDFKMPTRDVTITGSWTEKATDPVDPVEPTDPTDPTDPTNPTDPTDPADPADPEEPGEDLGEEPDVPLGENPEDPKEPAKPEEPEELEEPEEDLDNDPDVPLGETPDEDLGEEPDVPLGETPEEDLGDEPEVPLDGTPATGDASHTALWAALCGVSLAGLTVLGKKKEDEEA